MENAKSNYVCLSYEDAAKAALNYSSSKTASWLSLARLSAGGLIGIGVAAVTLPVVPAAIVPLALGIGTAGAVGLFGALVSKINHRGLQKLFDNANRPVHGMAAKMAQKVEPK